MQKIDFGSRHKLYDVEKTRQIEQLAKVTLRSHTLMQRAGLAIARLALAIEPHSSRIWIACGTGNNGGDGLEAAVHLQRWGKHPIVTWLGELGKASPDTAYSYQEAIDAGVTFAASPPLEYDLCIDALLGIGTTGREPEGQMAEWIVSINVSNKSILAVDLPSGLHADTGVAAKNCVSAKHTLSLLTLKPGLFTARGRDVTGTIWLDDLGVQSNSFFEQIDLIPTAWLAGPPGSQPRRHDSHKGSYGDVMVVGGAPGMTGAPILSASAALETGAGRVFVVLLDGGSVSVDVCQPELMFKSANELNFRTMTVVCGCGGGDEIRKLMPEILSTSVNLVLDADALNAIAKDVQLRTLLIARGKRALATILTPHPLEAARLLGKSTAEVQSDRLLASLQMTKLFNCTVVLKGSGTVIASPGQTPIINPTGNAKLATAGTGDVLAGMIGAALASGLNAFTAASESVFNHGATVTHFCKQSTLTASSLAKAVSTEIPAI